MDTLSKEVRVCSIALCPPDSAYTLDDSKPRRDFYPCDVRDEDSMTEMRGYCISLFDEMTNPRTARFSDVVFDQSAGVAIVQRYEELATVLHKNLAQRWVEAQTPHDAHMLLFFLFWQGVPLSGQPLFFVSRMMNRAFSIEPSQDLFLIGKLVRCYRRDRLGIIGQLAHGCFQVRYAHFEVSQLLFPGRHVILSLNAQPLSFFSFQAHEQKLNLSETKVQVSGACAVCDGVQRDR